MLLSVKLGCPTLPGLPCRTAGHILRECTNRTGDCRLVTYREVCERRNDCVASTAAVSQLSHTLDWSQFIFAGDVEGSRLEFTSLSAHALSFPTSPSRIIAHVCDHLNSIGLGSVSNMVALLPHLLRETFEKLMVVKASRAELHRK